MLLRAASNSTHHRLPPTSSSNLLAIGSTLSPPLTVKPFSSNLRGGGLSLPLTSSAFRLARQSLFDSPRTFCSLCFKLVSSSSMPLGHLRPSLTAAASFSTRSSFEVGKEILVQHLLVKDDDLQLLVEVQKRVSEGEDLSDLAVEYSMCPSKEEGGMLGWVRKGQMVPEFEEAAFCAPLNKVVRCKTKFGWHLLQVLAEREESVLEDVQPNELHEKMQDPSFFEKAQLIDVREPEEVDKASLPGFLVLPLRQFGSWGPEITHKFDPQKDVYVLCHHGMRSLQVAKWLQTQGFRRVFNVAGGIHEYAVKVDPSIPTY